MHQRSWHNGRFYLNWQVDEILRKYNIDESKFNTLDDLSMYLFNLMFDHSHNGKLDDIGLDLENCRSELLLINKE